jgi:hypothetical protein
MLVFNSLSTPSPAIAARGTPQGPVSDVAELRWIWPRSVGYRSVMVGDCGLLILGVLLSAVFYTARLGVYADGRAILGRPGNTALGCREKVLSYFRPERNGAQALGPP